MELRVALLQKPTMVTLCLSTFLVLQASLQVSKAASSSDLGAPTHLRVENLFSEVAVLSERKPRFSFVPPPAPKGAFNTLQSSYRITVSDDKTTVWDSGNVASDATAQIEVCCNITYMQPEVMFYFHHSNNTSKLDARGMKETPTQHWCNQEQLRHTQRHKISD